MAKIKLTKANIDGLKAAGQDVVYWDDALAGFGLKVTRAFYIASRDKSCRSLSIALVRGTWPVFR
jgi:hypothetical protein